MDAVSIIPPRAIAPVLVEWKLLLWWFGRSGHVRSLLSDEFDSGSTKLGGYAGSVSLILPQAPGSTFADHVVAEYRRILEEEAGFHSVEVIVSSVVSTLVSNGSINESEPRGSTCRALVTQVRAETGDWPGLVRAGLAAATGEHLVVLDVNRHYSPESLLQVIGPVSLGWILIWPWRCRATADRVWKAGCDHAWGLALISRMLLGTSDVFSGLFALRRCCLGFARQTSARPTVPAWFSTRCCDDRLAASTYP